MQKSQSLRTRKFNITVQKTSKYLENISELNEKSKNDTKIKKVIPQIPDLHLPVKKINHITNKKEKNKKINKISLEKLKKIVINIRMNKREKNQDKKPKHLIHIKKQFNITTKVNPNIKHKNKKIASEIKNDIIYNKNNLNLVKAQHINEFNYNSENNKNNNDIDINKIRSNSIKSDINNTNNNNNINNSALLKSELSQIRNDNKKWYDIDYLTEKYNDLILTTENLEKNLINKYLTGTDNIISEIEEPKYLKDESDINTINGNPSLRKHLSIRETTLDTSYQGNSYYNHTDKLKGNTNSFVRKIKNYRKIFKKYKTNLNFKHCNKNKNVFNNRCNKEKKRIKIRSINKTNNHNNSENNSVVNRYTYHRNNSGNITINENLRNSDYSKQKRISVYKIRRNVKNKSDMEQNTNQFLSIINEANDLIKSECKKRYYRSKSKNNNETKLYNKNKYNSKYIKNKFKKLQQSINDINPINLFISEKKRPLKNRYNTTHINNYITSSINEYDLGPDIGVGSYAEVKLGIHKKTKKKYAIKIYKKNTFDDEDKKNSIKNEIYILNQLNHENIMKLYDIINTPKNFYLILEYINGISLLDYIQQQPNKRIEENFCKNIFYQIVKAIEYCSKKNIYHRDIKLENILLTHNNNIKIIDFGFAIKCSKKEYQNFFCGTLYYMPPEIVNKKKYLPYYSDIWSLGVLLYTMIFGRFPFNANNDDDLFDLINEGKFEFPKDIETSEELKNLIEKIIVVEPSKRPSLNEILNDIWFKSDTKL